MTLPILKTERLILRPWKKSDLEPFCTMNQDPKVMEFYPSTLTKKESDAFAQKIQREYAQRGYGFWAIEVPKIANFIGYVGLNYWDLKMDFAPCIDIGWRLASPFWGKGYATEGAKEVLHYSFENLKLEEIVAMATIGNFRSHRIMEKLGMQHSPKENFHHPKLPKEHPLSLRVLYRLPRKKWISSRTSHQKMGVGKSQ